MKKVTVAIILSAVVIPAAFAGTDATNCSESVNARIAFEQGRITEAEYKDLLGGLADLREMRQIAGKNVRPANCMDFADHYKAQLAAGQISESEYQDLLAGVADLQAMKRLAGKKSVVRVQKTAGYEADAILYKEQLAKGEITKDEYNDLMGGLADLREMQRIAKSKRVSSKATSTIDFEANAKLYKEQLAKGEITKDEYNSLMGGLADLREMQRIAKSKRVSSKATSTIDFETNAKLYKEQLAKGEITKDEYNDLMGGLADLKKMQDIAKSK